MYSVSLSGSTMQCGMEYTRIILQTKQDQEIVFLLENFFRGGNSSVMGDRYVKTDGKRDSTH